MANNQKTALYKRILASCTKIAHWFCAFQQRNGEAKKISKKSKKGIDKAGIKWYNTKAARDWVKRSGRSLKIEQQEMSTKQVLRAILKPCVKQISQFLKRILLKQK